MINPNSPNSPNSPNNPNNPDSPDSSIVVSSNNPMDNQDKFGIYIDLRVMMLLYCYCFLLVDIRVIRIIRVTILGLSSLLGLLEYK